MNHAMPKILWRACQSCLKRPTNLIFDSLLSSQDPYSPDLPVRTYQHCLPKCGRRWRQITKYAVGNCSRLNLGRSPYLPTWNGCIDIAGNSMAETNFPHMFVKPVPWHDGCNLSARPFRSFSFYVFLVFSCVYCTCNLVILQEQPFWSLHSISQTQAYLYLPLSLSLGLS